MNRRQFHRNVLAAAAALAALPVSRFADAAAPAADRRHHDVMMKLFNDLAACFRWISSHRTSFSPA